MMMIMRQGNLLFCGFLALALAFAPAGCSSGGNRGGTSSSDDDDGGGGGDTPGGAAPTPVVTVAAALTGSVSSDVIDTDGASGKVSPRANKLGRDVDANACAGVSVSAYEVGGGAVAVAQGTVAADGTFSLTWSAVVADAETVAAEVVLVFSCSTGATVALKCYGRPGDTGLLCDPVSNAVVAALETALGTSVEGDALFRGLSVATIAAGMVETIKLSARLDPSDDVLDRLLASTDPATLASIIQASPVGALLVALEALAQERRAANEAAAAALAAGSAAPDDATTTSAYTSVWTIDRLVNLVVGLGMEVVVDIDGGREDGPPMLYGFMQRVIDTASETSVIADFQAYLSDLHTTLIAGDGAANATATVAMLCIARNHENWQQRPVTYPPDVAQVAASGIKKLTCVGSTAVSLGVATAVGALKPAYETHLFLRARNVEPDRNDLDGSREDQHRIRTEVGLVEIFPEFEEGLQSTCAQFIDPSGHDGPGPNTDWVGLAECIRDNGLGRYFSGLVGLYRFLTRADLHGVKISLRDLHEALVGDMGVRITTRLQNGFDGFGVQVTDIPDQQFGASWQVWLPMMLAEGDADSSGRTSLTLTCPEEICLNGLPDRQASITASELDTIIERYAPSFDRLFGELTLIPDFETIRRWIFTGSHHEPWNIAGPEFYHVLGKDVIGDRSTDRPILCVMTNGTGTEPVREFVPGTTVVGCEVAQGTWDSGALTAGSTTKPYGRYFGLQQRGGNDSNERYYALVSLYTGEDYRFNGRDFRLLDTSLGAVVSGASADGTTLHETNREFCDTNTDQSGAIVRNCWHEQFSYVLVNFPNMNTDSSVAANDSFYPQAFYNPFRWPMEFNVTNEATGQTWQWWQDVALAQRNPDAPTSTSGETRDAYPVCLAQNAVTLDVADDGRATALNLTGNVADCDSIETPVFYYLALHWTPDGSTRAAFPYRVVRNDGREITDARQACTSDQPCPPLIVALDAVETALLAALETALGDTAVSLGPDSAQVFVDWYRYANPRHDGKFDPFCIDSDGDAQCDCYRDNDGDGTFEMHLAVGGAGSAAGCSLADAVGDETTLSEPPAWPGDPSSAVVWRLIEACGNLAGAELQACLATQAAAGYDITRTWADWQKLFECENATRRMGWMDPWAAADAAAYIRAGGDCGTYRQEAGTVRLRRIVKRRNAFDVARPKQLLKLVSAATLTVGTGVEIDPDADVFPFRDAVAMAFLRLSLPLGDVVIRGPDFSRVRFDSTGQVQGVSTELSDYIEYAGARTVFQQIPRPGTWETDVISSVLRRFLLQEDDNASSSTSALTDDAATTDDSATTGSP